MGEGSDVSRERVDPAMFGAVLAVLWAAHDVADHVVQTEYQAARKADPGRVGALALAGHVGSYTAVQLGALAALSVLTGQRLTWRRMFAGVLFSAFSHAFLDRRWPVRRILEWTGHDSFSRPPLLPAHRYPGGHGDESLGAPAPVLPLHGPYVADQALHHVALSVTAAIIAGGR